MNSNDIQDVRVAQDFSEIVLDADLTSVRCCPACGGENVPDAVFCAMVGCGKALGGFQYVLEELHRDSRWIERVADRVTRATGKPHFVTFHLAWFALWVFLNSGLVATVVTFDAYPYSLLGIVLAIEATLMSLFLLISNNRQNAHLEKRAAMDYEINVRAYRLINRMHAILERQEQQPDKTRPAL